MTMDASRLFEGTVVHRRLRPRPHRLRYRVFGLLLDLDEVNGLTRRLKTFSRGKFNVVSFHERDHGDGSEIPLKTQIERRLLSAGMTVDGGPIRIFTMPRILGYAFNPLSVYFCYRRSGVLHAVQYEVNNTFGERHCYSVSIGDGVSGLIRHQVDKQFHVSPFLGMDMTYSFSIRPPGDQLSIGIVGHDRDGPIITAALSATGKRITDASVVGALCRHPFLTYKVLAGIYWHALQLWMKGLPLHNRPPLTSGKAITWGTHPCPRQQTDVARFHVPPR